MTDHGLASQPIHDTRAGINARDSGPPGTRAS